MEAAAVSAVAAAVPPSLKKSLVAKLAEVMGEVGRIAKSGRNTFHNYDYATEADIVESVRGAMSERGLMLIPSVEKTEWREVPGKQGPQKICTLTVKYRLIDGETNEGLEFTILGEGQDQGDKATYKALTGATKYALLKLFLIPTGDDSPAVMPKGDRPESSQARQTPPLTRQAQIQTKPAATAKHTAATSSPPATSPAGRAATGSPPATVTDWFDRIRTVGAAHGKEGKALSSFVQGCGITKKDPKSYTSEDFAKVAGAFVALNLKAPGAPAAAASPKQGAAK